MSDPGALSRRERQIMDVLYAQRDAAAADVQAALADPPSYSTVRALLRRLVEKGHVTYRQDGARYLYRPVVERGRARRSAFRRVIDTFFGGSTKDAVVNLLGSEAGDLTAADFDEIEQSLRELKHRNSQARRDGRRRR
jgi:BlaI family transcriptional regulator, penicillinase repressor